MIRLPIITLLTCLYSLPLLAADIYVATSGNDHYPGTADRPKATLNAAIRHARELRRLNDPAIKGGIHIIVKGGLYALYEPVFIRPEDAGTADSPTTIEAAEGELPVLSGGVHISGWRPAGGKQKIWVADLPSVGNSILDFRQLWVNNHKAIRAKDMPGDSMRRILSWNHKDGTCWIPASSVKGLDKAPGLEMFIHQWWAIANLRIKSMRTQGDSTQLSFYQPESNIQSEHPWPAPWVSKESGNSAFLLTNALPLLDEPGEWYLDVKAQKVYYWPHAQEDLSRATVIAPVLESLVVIQGTIDHPVSHIRFKGISFQHTTWLRPSQKGHVPLQAGLFMLDAYKLDTPGTPDKKGLENQAWIGRPPAAADVAYATQINFTGCRFEHLASTGLDYRIGCRYDTVKGCLFKDIGGTGIQLGTYSDEATETHLPFQPADTRVVCSNLLITNNLITDVTNDDWGTLGISAGYVSNVTITHNEISEVSYTGISVGWGWTKTVNVMHNNRITANKIHHYAKRMYDVAGIYTLSAQPGSEISYNYIDSIYKAPYAHLPEHWFYLYTDEGTAYYTVKDNWCPAEKFLRNANGPNNIWERNGPQVSDSIKLSAGLEAPYKYLLKESAQPSATQPINQHHQ
ncbi:right-handed parallel beta-helix repeat-containing protein [Chitinophaga rhizophila]|uniref:Right-handed parallel beta-helix repeat-containing protein n=1 Tax=Chitinophaga rhizophila TaxID=2866212 RepID=A0ABS7GAD5_9BACT|nr:right-handed parallel beta-helix repeat-containing protein [Chitinophaga rhizophila]MBW8684623.1 right-handed parallel beta-helix repeat-containing protein [Chitinophaga rhizophila]